MYLPQRTRRTQRKQDKEVLLERVALTSRSPFLSFLCGLCVLCGSSFSACETIAAPQELVTVEGGAVSAELIKIKDGEASFGWKAEGPSLQALVHDSFALDKIVRWGN